LTGGLLNGMLRGVSVTVLAGGGLDIPNREPSGSLLSA